MPSDPVYFTVWDDILTRLGNMRKAEGYHLDYGKVLAGARSYGIQDSDYANPKVGVRWLGELFRDPITGGNLASHTTERLPQFEITVPVRRSSGPDDSTRRAFRVVADVHKALMGATSTETSSAVRTRGLSNTATWETDVRWLDVDEAGDPIGGTLLIVYTVRFNHATGDLATVR